MPSGGSSDILQQAVDGFAQRVSDYASGIADRLGQPLSGQQLSKDDAVQRWNFTPMGSTDQADAAYHQMVATGTPPGQALSQVYPMRSMLTQGSDINDSIAKAKQIAGWAADAAGQSAPEPFEGSTMPLALAQQNAASNALPAAPSSPAMPPPMSSPGGLPAPMPAPSPMPAPLPTMGAGTTPALMPPSPMPQPTGAM